MLKIRHKRSGITEVLAETGANMQTLGQVSSDVADEVVRQNSDVNLDPEHADTVITTSSERITVGSRSESYAQLLRIDDADAVLAPIREHIRAKG